MVSLWWLSCMPPFFIVGCYQINQKMAGIPNCCRVFQNCIKCLIANIIFSSESRIESVNGHFWSNLCLKCNFKWTWFVKTHIWSVIDRSRVRFSVAAALFFFVFPPFSPLFWLGSPSVPLKFPKLANAQPSNFGPLRIFRNTFFWFFCKCIRFSEEKLENGYERFFFRIF